MTQKQKRFKCTVWCKCYHPQLHPEVGQQKKPSCNAECVICFRPEYSAHIFPKFCITATMSRSAVPLFCAIVCFAFSKNSVFVRYTEESSTSCSTAPELHISALIEPSSTVTSSQGYSTQPRFFNRQRRRTPQSGELSLRQVDRTYPRCLLPSTAPCS